MTSNYICKLMENTLLPYINFGSSYVNTDYVKMPREHIFLVLVVFNFAVW